MINKFLNKIFNILDYVIAHQVPSCMGFGHQINSKAGLDQNSLFISNKVAKIDQPIKILELAAGRGILAQEILLYPQVEKYVACDIDPSGLEILKNRAVNKFYFEKLETVVQDVLNPTVSYKEYFDIVIADKLIHLFSPEDVYKIFLWANSVLKPGGIFFLSSASKTNAVFKRTVPSNKHELYRKLVSNNLIHMWYNIKNPYVFFVTTDFLMKLADVTNFVYSTDLVCHNTKNYITLGLYKDIYNLNTG